MNNRTDLAIDNINIKKTKEYKKNNILISEYKNKNKLYITLHFNSLIEKNNIKKILKTQLLCFQKQMGIANWHCLTYILYEQDVFPLLKNHLPIRSSRSLHHRSAPRQNIRIFPQSCLLR